jgi:hypothetical protein
MNRIAGELLRTCVFVCVNFTYYYYFKLFFVGETSENYDMRKCGVL